MSAGDYYNQGPPRPPHQQSHSPHPPPQQPYLQPSYPGSPQSNSQAYHQGPPPNQSYQSAPYPQSGAGSYSQPPPGQFGWPPPSNSGPSPNQYGPPSWQSGEPGPPAAPPSPGYDPGQQSYMDMSQAADQLHVAMKRFGTDEKILIRILAPLDPLEIKGVKAAYYGRHNHDLLKDIHSETSGHVREGLLAICRGPLDQDSHVVHQAIQGAGTRESALNDVLLARSNADINAIKARYHHNYQRTLESDVKGDLSMKTERLFDMVMSARRNEESTPVIPQQTDADVQEIYRATEGRMGTDHLAVCSVLTSRSNGQILAIAQAYKARYHRSLEENIRKEFSGHMEQALLYILRSAEDPAKHDADLLEDAMRGLGTNDEKLIRRVVMIHWNPHRLDQCKRAYQHFYHRSLAERIRGETRGDYEKLLLACIGGA